MTEWLVGALQDFPALPVQTSKNLNTLWRDRSADVGLARRRQSTRSNELTRCCVKGGYEYLLFYSPRDHRAVDCADSQVPEAIDMMAV